MLANIPNNIFAGVCNLKYFWNTLFFCIYNLKCFVEMYIQLHFITLHICFEQPFRCLHFFPLGRTGMRANTVLAGSKLKLERFVMLLWNFAERGKTYQQISNAANLPAQSHYVEDKLSGASIAKWNKYFRYLCKEDYLKNKKQVGGKDCIVEIDETMCQSCKI